MGGKQNITEFLLSFWDNKGKVFSRIKCFFLQKKKKKKKKNFKKSPFKLLKLGHTNS